VGRRKSGLGGVNPGRYAVARRHVPDKRFRRRGSPRDVESRRGRQSAQAPRDRESWISALQVQGRAAGQQRMQSAHKGGLIERRRHFPARTP